jgi:hypothetical protein
MNQITWKYDERGDVMYISFGAPVPCGCIEPAEVSGICLRYALDDHRLNGITIIDYNRRTDPIPETNVTVKDNRPLAEG